LYLLFSGAVSVAPKAEDIRFKTKPDWYVSYAVIYSYLTYAIQTQRNQNKNPV
jgi:hypothetical protein